MKKTLKKIISVLLVLSLTLGISAIAPTEQTEPLEQITEPESSEKFYEGFTIPDASAASTYSVSSTEEDDSDQYDVYALLEFDYPDLDLSTLEGLDTVARRDAVRDYYKPRNEQIVAQLGLENVTVSYSAPYADVSFDSISDYQTDRAELITASESDAVEFIGVDLISTQAESTSAETESDTVPDYPLADALEDVGIDPDDDYIKDSDGNYILDEEGNRILYGTGIKVGILEDGLPDISNANFPENTVIEILGPESEMSNHTTSVASIIGGSNGIAPGVSFYCAYLKHSSNIPSDTTEYNITNALNWLLNEKYVDLVNFSATYYLLSDFRQLEESPYYWIDVDESKINMYTKFCAYMDYMFIANGCMLIQSSGNTAGQIVKPAMAVNTLTVGSTNANGAVSDFSSYQEGTNCDGIIHKPEVVAPGENIVIGSADPISGTSFSAPIVTGIAARLMHEFPQLKREHSLLKTVIMSGSNGTPINEKSGFGRVNYSASKTIMQTKNYGLYTKNTQNVAAGTKVFEGSFKIPTQTFFKMTLSRMVMGANTEISNTAVAPQMTPYTVRLTVTSGTLKGAVTEFEWDESAYYYSYPNAYSDMEYKLEIFVSGTGENPYEEIAVAYKGAEHIHKYTASYFVKNNTYHNSYCTCGSSILEDHEYPETEETQRYCILCTYPENYFPN